MNTKSLRSEIAPPVSRMMIVGWLAVATSGGGPCAQSPDPPGWRPVSVREEIRPEFRFKSPDRLIIRSDKREGLAGHWEKTFAVTGG
jgi:hypothetical protein